MEYKIIQIDKIHLDLGNPRIAPILTMYGSEVTADQISLALVSVGSDSSHTTFASLKESIKTNGGIIHPIIVNRKDNKYIVIEGNTRVQIYRDFKKSKTAGNWDEIIAIVYDNLPESEIHAIRLQTHLVGPRDWNPYSKGKYLSRLYNEEQLSMGQIVDFCGGDYAKTKKYIDAYTLMEDHYRPQLNSDDEFDPEKFSAFVEYQNGKVVQAVANHGYSVNDFASWIISEKISPLSRIRQLPEVLNNKEAREAFLNGTISDAIRVIESASPSSDALQKATLDQLAFEISKRIRAISYEEMKKYRASSSYANKKTTLIEALDQLSEFCDEISGDY